MPTSPDLHSEYLDINEYLDRLQRQVFGLRNRMQAMDRDDQTAATAAAVKSYRTLRAAATAFNELCRYPGRIERGY